MPGASVVSSSTFARAISLVNVTKRFGNEGTLVLEDINLEVEPGEFLCIVGASGSGKTTLLNIIAGLEKVSAGGVNIPSGRTAFMFQDAALLPWLTARKNIETSLRFARVPKALWGSRVAELLALVRLSAAGAKRPHELSGGMRQRIALARALAQDRKILLMDEPFAALDAITRDLLHDELERIWRETGRTIVFVTHNVLEAVRLADRVVLMSSHPGKIVGEWRIDSERPRHMDSPHVAELATEITARLRQELPAQDGQSVEQGGESSDD
jgi:NitT/TauT family transport system ATP-binding protein